MEGQGGEGMLHFRDLVPRLLARWHWIVLGLIVGLALGFYQVWRAIPQYQARSTVLVRDYNVSTMGNLDPAEFDLRNLQAIETVRAGFLTYELAEEVAADPVVRELKGLIPPEPKALPFGSSKDDPSEDETPPASQLAGMIQGWLYVQVREESRLIDIIVQHPKPLVAQTIANRMVEQYRQQRTEARAGDQSSRLTVLVEESKRVKKELQEAQNTLASYSAPLEAEKALAAAETDLQTLSLRYRHKHPRMIEAQARLTQSQERLKEFLLKAVRNPFDGEYWAGHRDRMTDLENPDTIDQLRDLLISRRAVLESEIASQNSLYGTLLSRIEAGQVNENQTEAEVEPYEAARLPGIPISPNKPRLIIQASALGLFAGLALAFMFHLLDNRFHTVADVEGTLGLPTLAAVAELDPNKIEKEEAKRRKDEETAWVSGREQWPPTLVFRTEGANSHYAEMFRVLRTAVSLLGPADQRKVSLITSALPSEGKTLVTANLAVAFAQQGVRTLLVDFDLRKPSLHNMFGLAKDSQAGVVDVLTAGAEIDSAVQPAPGQANLSLMLSGPKAPNPGELLELGRLESLLEHLRERYDHIVLDTAPLLAVPDTRILAPLAENLLLVVRGEATPRGAVKRAVEILEGFQVTPEGVVFNGYLEKRSLIGKNYSYGYYRYGKYGYGKYGYGYGKGGTYGAVYGEEDK